MENVYLDELKVIAEGDNLEAIYGALVALRSIFQDGVRGELERIVISMALRLRQAGWTVDLGLSNSSSGAWFIPPDKV